MWQVIRNSSLPEEDEYALELQRRYLVNLSQGSALYLHILALCIVLAQNCLMHCTYAWDVCKMLFFVLAQGEMTQSLIHVHVHGVHGMLRIK